MLFCGREKRGRSAIAGAVSGRKNRPQQREGWNMGNPTSGKDVSWPPFTQNTLEKDGSDEKVTPMGEASSYLEKGYTGRRHLDSYVTYEKNCIRLVWMRTPYTRVHNTWARAHTHDHSYFLSPLKFYLSSITVFIIWFYIIWGILICFYNHTCEFFLCVFLK